MRNQTHRRQIVLDKQRQELRCTLEDGVTTIVAESLADMERSLDLVDEFVGRRKRRERKRAHGPVRD